MVIAPPAAVLEIARTLERHGYETWAVGGAVRDALLGRESADWDLATSARPDEVRRIFRRTVPIGIEHGTVGVLGADRMLYEVTTFRRDIETFGRHAVVEYAESVDEDLARRDFTLNAVAWHPLRHELHDPFGGMDDLRAHVLRTVGEPADRFAEDYLRVLRALRFAGHFGLEIEPRTWSALTDAVPQLYGLSAERVREELWKVLAKTKGASATLRLYERSSALSQLYLELAALVGLEVDGDDAWSRSLAAVDAVPPHRTLLRVAALLHAIGMPVARSRDLRGGWRYVGHEKIGARKASDLMRRLRVSNADRDRVAALIARQSDLFPPDAPPAGIRRWLRDVGPELVRDLFRLRIALWRAAPVERGQHDLYARWRVAHAVLLQHPVLTVAGLTIGGRELRALGIEPGPRYGEILRALLERVIDEPELNEPERLIEMARAAAEQ